VSSLPLLLYNPTQQHWFWEFADATVAVLVLVNFAVIAFVYVRRARQTVRLRRANRFRASLGPLLDQALTDENPEALDQLRRRARNLNELERPVAAELLLQRLRPAAPVERARIRALIEETGAVELMLRGTRRWRPWRRALALRTLGWLGEERAVPVLLERLHDRSRYVREASVRALGRIGDRRALLPLEQLYLDPKRDVASGFVHEAVASFGEDASPVFRQGLQSADESIRVSSCFGVGSVLEVERARPLLEGMLADPSPAVRAAALDVLGRIGGEQIPPALVTCSRDYQPSVRRAAATTLGSYNDSRAVGLLGTVLLDPDRDTVIRAGESLVRLARAPGPIGKQAAELLEEQRLEWPVERAQVLASLGAL
jgi:HEAT repeat protein